MSFSTVARSLPCIWAYWAADISMGLPPFAVFDFHNEQDGGQRGGDGVSYKHDRRERGMRRARQFANQVEHCCAKQ